EIGSGVSAGRPHGRAAREGESDERAGRGAVEGGIARYDFCQAWYSAAVRLKCRHVFSDDEQDAAVIAFKLYPTCDGGGTGARLSGCGGVAIRISRWGSVAGRFGAAGIHGGRVG